LECIISDLKTGIEKDFNEYPSDFYLYQNYPNPFNPVTTINYSLPSYEKVVIKVYDILGREIAEPVDEFKTAGKYSIQVDGSNLSSGVYFYSVSAGSKRQVKKMLLTK
jgi:hypothetical protein